MAIDPYGEQGRGMGTGQLAGAFKGKVQRDRGGLAQAFGIAGQDQVIMGAAAKLLASLLGRDTVEISEFARKGGGTAVPESEPSPPSVIEPGSK